MKKTKQILKAFLFSFLLLISCNKDDDTAQVMNPIQQDPMDDPMNPNPSGQFEMVDVIAILPPDSNMNLENTTLFTLASPAVVNTNGTGVLPFNPGTGQLTYLLDSNNNVLLAGFLTDNRKEVSVETTAEVILYFGLGYQLLPDSIKLPYIDAVQQVAGFSNFVSEIKSLFESNPLMYTEGTYTSSLNATIDELVIKETIDIAARIEVDSQDTRSGITVSDVDATNVQVQNSYPRRAHTFVYKKSSTDLDGNETQISNFTANAISDFKLEPGGTNSGVDAGTISVKQQCDVASQSNVQNTTTSDPINLPVQDDELSAEYEVVVVGPGKGNSGSERGFTAAEKAKFEELSKEAFILDNFLPTLLDIGGNKGLLPPVGDAKETALVNKVLPFLEANPDVLSNVLANDFDAASKDFIPFLYEDIRQSNDLREILKGIYDVLDGGEFPNTFIQSQELLETGEARFQSLTRIIDRNINSYNNKCNNYRLDDSANFESWTVKSSDGNVKVGPECLTILFDEVGDITARATVDLEENQTLEYDWSTGGSFGGRIQDINGDASNFGTSITSSDETVSFSSVALQSDLGDDDNIENVTVTAFIKNADGSRSEIGSDQMKVNIKKRSFIISPNEVCIEGGKNVVLRIRHNDGETAIPNETTDYKLVWKTSGKYGKFNGRNTVETTYNNEIILFNSLDEEIEEGADQVSVQIYSRAKGSNDDYSLVDDPKGTVTTKNDPNCDFDLYGLEVSITNPPIANPEQQCRPGVTTAWSGRIVINVPKDENATRYSVEWNEIYRGTDNAYINRAGYSWTNDNLPGSLVADNGDSFEVYSQVGSGVSCSDFDVSGFITRLNSISGFATVTVCYD